MFFIPCKKEGKDKESIQSSTTPDTHVVLRLMKTDNTGNFSAQFIKILSHYKKRGLNINLLQKKHAWWSTHSWLVAFLSS